MEKEKYIIHFGILPNIRNEEEFNIVEDFFKLMKEKFKKVYYTLPKDGISNRLKNYEQELLKLMEDLEIPKSNEYTKNHIFIEEDKENSLETILGDDPRFKNFAKLLLEYIEDALRKKINYEESAIKKQKYKNDLEKYEKIKERFFQEVYQQEFTQTQKQQQEQQRKTNTLYIHLDLANFFPKRKNNWHDLRMWAEFLNSAISITRKKLNHTGDYKVITYLESYFNPTKTKDIEALEDFLDKRLEKIVIQDSNKEKFVKNFITFLYKIMGFTIEIAPKEAEQLIPDAIREIKKEEPDSLHAILSDDSARDYTECDLRVVHTEERKVKVKNKGKAKDVISLEEYTFDPFIKWFFEKNTQTEEEPPKTIKTYNLEDIKPKIEDFSLLPNPEQKLTILGILYHNYKSPENFKNFWTDIETETKDKFYEDLKNFKNEHLKIRILLTLYDIEDDTSRKRKIIDLLKESKLEENVVEILSIVADEEDLERKLNHLRKRHSDKIELNQKIKELKKEIDKITNLAKDKNINEERKNELENQLKKIQTEYKNLEKTIQNYENQINNLQQIIEKSEEQKKVLEDKIQKTTEEKDKLQKEIERLENEVRTLDIEKRNKKNMIGELTKQKDQLEEEKKDITLQEQNLQKYIKDLESSLETKKGNITILNQKKEELENKILEQEPIIKKLQEEVKDKEQQLEEYEKIQQTYNKLIQKEKMEEYIQKHKEELQFLDQNIEYLKLQINHLEQTLKNKQKENKRLSEDKEKLEKELKKLQIEEQNLKKEIKLLVENSEKYNTALEELEKRKSSLKEYEKLYKDKSSEIREFIAKIDNFIKTLS